MKSAGIQKLSLLDYPDHLAATVFTFGCNYRCPYCHNAELVTGTFTPTINESYIFEFLEGRKGILDGVCITGGEPTLQHDLVDFCKKIKASGFLVKLDTNGSFPEKLEELLAAQVLDYVAIDLKNTEYRYAETCGVTHNPYTQVMECIQLLEKHSMPYELRTTIVQELHTKSDLIELAAVIPPSCKWLLQNFQDSPNVLGGTGIVHPWDKQGLASLLPHLRKIAPLVQIRGEN